MTLKVNFTDVSDRPPAKPKGWYRVRISDGEVKTTSSEAKNPNLEYLNLELTIQEGDYKGQKFWTGLHVLIEKALPIVKGFLRATGKFNNEQLDGELEFDSWEELLNLLKGAELMVYNVPEPYEGVDQDRLKPNYKSLEGNTPGTSTVKADSSLLP